VARQPQDRQITSDWEVNMEAAAQAADRRTDELGKRGEDVAAEYLAGIGLVVLSRNWRCRGGEVDVVATDGQRLIVCEVKTRSGTGYGEPAEGVTAAKAARIRRVAAAWLRTHRVGWCEIRFDVLAVLCPAGGPVTVEHLQGAF
jgi:putative endonuclease